MMVAALFSRAASAVGASIPSLHHGTDDADSAYYRVACSTPGFTVVAIFDTVLDEVAYYTMPGHNFGLVTAVLTWNRVTRFSSSIARRLFGVACAAYFDDFDTCEPAYAGRSGKDILRSLHGYLTLGSDDTELQRVPGILDIPLASAKDRPMLPVAPFLGVVSDLTAISRGIGILSPKPDRVAKLLREIPQILEKGSLPPSHAKKLAGKVFFLLSTAFGRVGRPALASLFRHAAGPEDGGDEPFSWEVRAALEFLLALLPYLPPKRIIFGRRRRRPVLVWTDAAYSRSSDPPGRLGAVVFDPEADRWRHASMDISQEWLTRFAEKRQYIGQLECLAAVAVYFSLPELRGRDVIHFIDNTGALSALAKGYTGDIDSARLVHAFHMFNAAAQANVWFNFVPSGANISDLPSRGRVDEYLSIIMDLFDAASEEFEMALPPCGSWQQISREASKLAGMAPGERHTTKRQRSR